MLVQRLPHLPSKEIASKEIAAGAAVAFGADSAAFAPATGAAVGAGLSCLGREAAKPAELASRTAYSASGSSENTAYPSEAY